MLLHRPRCQLNYQINFLRCPWMFVSRSRFEQ